MRYVLGVYLPGFILGSLSLAWLIHLGLWPVLILTWALVSGLGVAVGFHRVYSHSTHKELSPWLDNLLLLLGTLGGQGSSISWVAVHRGYHHKYSDTVRDLHSPVHGFWSAFIGWYWKLKPDTINHKYAVDLLRRPNHVFLHKHYINFLWVFCLVLGLISIKLLAVYAATLFISLCQDNGVNTICHTRKLGYKNFPTTDNSVNFAPLGYFGWGQGWHENHHAEPATFSFGRRWWEFDPCVLWLPFLGLGSVRNANS